MTVDQLLAELTTIRDSTPTAGRALVRVGPGIWPVTTATPAYNREVGDFLLLEVRL